MCSVRSISEMVDFLNKCERIELQDGCGANIRIPKYELSPEDYLEFAETDKNGDSIKDKINTVSNLKRALECQIDTFLGSLNLMKICDKNNLKFEKKTKFLSLLGLLSVTSINKLNNIRNKMEHDYSIPTIDDVEAYYELTWYVIEILNAHLLCLSTFGEITFSLFYKENEFCFSTNYDVVNCSFKFELGNWTNSESRKAESQILTIYMKNESDQEYYAKAFKLHIELIKFFHFNDLVEFKRNINKITKI